MDAVNEVDVTDVVVMSSAQVGKTEGLNNIVGYYIDQDPSPMLLVQPTLEMGQAWSKDRFAPMLRDTPTLRGKVRDARTRDSDNTILHKTFPGGHITIAGANSAAGLASRPVRILLLDEVDRYPPSAGSEGDPVNLARKRTTTFWNRKIVMTSTPTIKGASRIEAAYQASDQRKYYVPCPHCKEMQLLVWGGRETPHGMKWPDGQPELAYYVCEYCHGKITDAHKQWMLANGEWRATKPFNGVAGFHINEIYSPWVRFGEMARSFVEAKKLPETLQTWVNTALGETWEQRGSTVNEKELLDRRENYGPAVPMDAYYLTAGVDVQDDRIEFEVVAWGKDYESWSITYQALHGDPAKPDLWNDLDNHLLAEYPHESGLTLKIQAVGVDTGGHHTQQAYAFCRKRRGRRVYALKGVGGMGRPLAQRADRKSRAKFPIYLVGSDAAKELHYSRLKIKSPGPGYCHFPAHYDEEYFKRLTAEKLIKSYANGRLEIKWVLKAAHLRNEPQDCRLYAMAALALRGANVNALAPKFAKRVEQVRDEVRETVASGDVIAANASRVMDQTTDEAETQEQGTQPVTPEASPSPRRVRKFRKSWISNW